MKNYETLNRVLKEVTPTKLVKDAEVWKDGKRCYEDKELFCDFWLYDDTVNELIAESDGIKVREGNLVLNFAMPNDKYEIVLGVGDGCCGDAYTLIHSISGMYEIKHTNCKKTCDLI